MAAARIGINVSQSITVYAGKMVSRTTGDEENGNHVAIGNRVQAFNYDTDTLCVVASNESSGMPTAEYVAENLGSYRYIMVVDKALAPKPTYYVVFDVNGLNVEVPGQYIPHGEKVSKPADPQVETFQFVGWYKDAQCNTIWDFTSDTVTSNTTIYAKWVEKNLTHVHTFGSEWSYDKSSHWVTCSSCSERNGASSHNFYDEGRCIVCGYQSQELNNNNDDLIKLAIGAAAAVVFLGIIIAMIRGKKKKKKSRNDSSKSEVAPQTDAQKNAAVSNSGEGTDESSSV